MAHTNDRTICNCPCNVMASLKVAGRSVFQQARLFERFVTRKIGRGWLTLNRIFMLCLGLYGIFILLLVVSPSYLAEVSTPVGLIVVYIMGAVSMPIEAVSSIIGVGPDKLPNKFPENFVVVILLVIIVLLEAELFSLIVRAIAGRVRRAWRRTRTAEQQLARDKKAPTLLLRSFDDDPAKIRS